MSTKWLTVIVSIAVGLSVPIVGFCQVQNSEQVFNEDVKAISSAPMQDIHPWPAPTYISLAPVIYWKLYAEWPGSWAEVEASGLFDRELYGVMGEVMHPDDPEWGFDGEVKYLPQAGGVPSMGTLANDDGVVINIRPLSQPASTFDDYFEMVVEETEHSQYGLLLEDHHARHRYALQRLMVEGTGMYFQEHGRVPGSFAKFLASPYAPMGVDTVNPATGVPYAGDGRPNDFLFTYTNPQRFKLFVTDSEGDTPWKF